MAVHQESSGTGTNILVLPELFRFLHVGAKSHSFFAPCKLPKAEIKIFPRVYVSEKKVESQWARTVEVYLMKCPTDVSPADVTSTLAPQQEKQCSRD